MTALENKILEALKNKNENMKKYDEDRKAEHDSYMKEAEAQTEEYWKKDLISKANWALHFQKHEYDFIEAWKNVISKVMYGRIYHEWHPAQAGKYKGTGYGAYVTSELTDKEKDNIDRVFNGLVRRGYIRLSKSGKQAKLV